MGGDCPRTQATCLSSSRIRAEPTRCQESEDTLPVLDILRRDAHMVWDIMLYAMMRAGFP